MSVAYPTPTGTLAVGRGRPPSASTAESLVLVALILQMIAAAVLIVGISAAIGFSLLNPYPHAWVVVLVTLIVGGAAVVFLYLAYTLSYLRIRRAEYEDAQAPTLVLGILSLFLGIVPGILYLIGYVKLGDALREQQAASLPPYGAAAASAGVAQIACRGCGRVYPIGAFGYCPNCGQKLAA